MNIQVLYCEYNLLKQKFQLFSLNRTVKEKLFSHEINANVLYRIYISKQELELTFANISSWRGDFFVKAKLKMIVNANKLTTPFIQNKT